ncbi:MAG: metallophosphoesterase family protein [Thermoleophilaceae bacterium]
MRLRRRAGGSRRRILFATDLHGSDVVFRKFLNAVQVYEADVAILGGDLTGKRIVPLIEERGGLSAEIGGRRVVALDFEEAAALERRVRDLGQYPVRMTLAEHERVADDDDATHAIFVEQCVAQVRDWMERAAERLEPLSVPLFVTGGNDDYLIIEDVLDAAPHAVNAEGEVLEVTPTVEMASTGYGNPTPWHCPRDISEEGLLEKIERMAEQLRDSRHAIFNLHVPPYSSGLDLCPRLDTRFDPPKPIVGEEVPAGSWAVRGSIERYGPMLSLHGHIHESPGIRRLGPTVAINPGSEYGEGILRSAVVDLATNGAVELSAAQLLTA